MDMSFSLRRKSAARRGATDLDSLLARIGAAQAASPTASAQTRLDLPKDPHETRDPRIALFGSTNDYCPLAKVAASFARIDDASLQTW